MTSSENHNNEHQRRIAEINHQAAGVIEQAANLQRRELIDAAFNGVLAHVAFQQARMDKLDDEGRLGVAAFDRTVLQSFARLPFWDDEPQNSFSIVLEPDENLGQERRGQEKIVVFLPVPEDFMLEPGFDPNGLERPKYIAVERYDAAGKVRSYIISDEKAEEFQGAYHTGTQLTGDEAINFDRMGEYFASRVDPMDAAVSQIMIDLTNWTVQVQR
ncbi:MAG: hypothetical protein ACREGF_01880, partial [Candidatus Saccharimonadales bacterium]